MLRISLILRISLLVVFLLFSCFVSYTVLILSSTAIENGLISNLAVTVLVSSVSEPRFPQEIDNWEQLNKERRVSKQVSGQVSIYAKES